METTARLAIPLGHAAGYWLLELLGSLWAPVPGHRLSEQEIFLGHCVLVRIKFMGTIYLAALFFFYCVLLLKQIS